MNQAARYVKIVEWSDEDHCFVLEDVIVTTEVPSYGEAYETCSPAGSTSS